MDFPKINKWKFAFEWCVSTYFGLIRLYKYSSDWDKELNELIDNYWQSAHINYCTIQLEEQEVWVANAYYGYGNKYGNGKEKQRPSMKTMYRLASLHEYLKEKESQEKVVNRLKGIDNV